MSDRTPHGEPSRDVAAVRARSYDYVRIATLGDSATFGLGDRAPGGAPRGWARLLAAAMARAHHVSLCNLAVSGAIIRDVRANQLLRGVQHSPHIASLVVGVNDLFRSDWDRGRARDDLLICASSLARGGALLLTPRFHNHGAILGLPRPLQRGLQRRIDELNLIYDEVDDRFGTLRLDLSQTPLADDRAYWSLDRMHPSELGHRYLARSVAELLNAEGLAFPLPSLSLDPSNDERARERKALMRQCAPWLARRVQDLAPWALRCGLAHLAPQL